MKEKEDECNKNKGLYIHIALLYLMNILKHKKILSYLSVIIIYILLVYFLLNLFKIFIPFLKLASLFISSLILTALTIWGIPFLLRLLGLQPRDDWIKLLSAKGLKIKYYNFVIKISKLWNISAIVVIITILASMLIYIINSFISNPINISEKLNVFSENPKLIPFLLILLTVYMIMVSFGFLGIFFFSLIFPENKVSGLPDASDIPTSFLEKANEEISLFSFLTPWEDKQQKKNKISNLMNNAQEFITIRDKILGVPHGFRYYQPFIGGLKNKSSKRDILYRINGFSEKLNKIIVDLNYMNTDADKEEISKNLIEYIDILKNRTLHKMEKVEYNRIGIIENIIRKIEPIKNLIVIIVAIYLGLESIKKIF
ncbi:MAG: hypothetical protein Q8M95_09820 [Candidatus Methanoperedens sp.]|nr:hypothetical protein [Candidatus Methanoperedens sp.]